MVKSKASRLCPFSASLLLFAMMGANNVVAAPPGAGAGNGGRGVAARGPAIRNSGPIITSPGANLTAPTVGRSFGAVGSPINATGYWSASGYHGITPPGVVNGTRGFFPTGNGGHRGPGRSYNNRLAWTPFLAPYYYPTFDVGNPYDPSSPNYGPDPNDPSGSSQDAQVLGNMIGQQLNDLSAQISDLRQQQQARQSGNDGSRPMTGSAGASPIAVHPEAEQPTVPVTLVLHDGQQLQVQNYAIVNGTFWDLSRTNSRKIPLISIDVRASVKATEDQGGEFPAIREPE